MNSKSSRCFNFCPLANGANGFFHPVSYTWSLVTVRFSEKFVQTNIFDNSEKSSIESNPIDDHNGCSSSKFAKSVRVIRCTWKFLQKNSILI